MLQVELTNIEDTYNSCKTTIISAIDLLHTNPSFDKQLQSQSQQSKSLVVPVQVSLENSSKIQGTQKCMQLLLQDLGSHHIQQKNHWLIDEWMTIAV